MMGMISFSTNSRAVCRTSFSSSFSCESKSMKSTPEYLAMLRSFCGRPRASRDQPSRKSLRGFHSLCGGGLLAADKLYAALGFAGKCLRAVSEFYPTGINRKKLLCVQCINLLNLAANERLVCLG